MPDGDIGIQKLIFRMLVLSALRRPGNSPSRTVATEESLIGGEMGIAENKQVVTDFYAAGAHGDMETCFALLADDVKWTNIGDTKFSGVFSGKQALVEKLLDPLFSQLKAGISSEIERLTAEGDVVIAQSVGTAETHDGTPYNNTYCQVMRIRDGKIAEVKEYFDTALVKAVFGDS
jgi:ketosteroid isomerase-like protein